MAEEPASLKLSWSLGGAMPAPVAPVEAAVVTESPAQGALPYRAAWPVQRNATIGETLKAWAAMARWRIAVDPEVVDERVDLQGIGSDSFTGTLFDAVCGLMAALPTRSPLGVDLWQGNEVVHVYVR
jgi:hypothetical protein